MIQIQQGREYTNSLVNADSFYENFTNATFQKVPISHLTRTYCEIRIMRQG